MSLVMTPFIEWFKNQPLVILVPCNWDNKLCDLVLLQTIDKFQLSSLMIQIFKFCSKILRNCKIFVFRNCIFRNAICFTKQFFWRFVSFEISTFVLRSIYIEIPAIKNGFIRYWFKTTPWKLIILTQAQQEQPPGNGQNQHSYKIVKNVEKIIKFNDQNQQTHHKN